MKEIIEQYEILQPLDEENNDNGALGRYLVFKINNINYALSLNYVTEIVGMQKATKVPKLPKYVDGVVNLRGKIVPIVDARAKFGQERAVVTERTSVVVIEKNESLIGLVVDSVEEVCTILPSSITTPLTYKTGIESKYVSGIGKWNNGTIFIMNGDMVLATD